MKRQAITGHGAGTLASLPAGELLEIITSDNPLSATALHYLLSVRCDVRLRRIYSWYASVLNDDYEDARGDFFLYLRDGRGDHLPYAALRGIRRPDRLYGWIYASFRYYLTNEAKRRRRPVLVPLDSISQTVGGRIDLDYLPPEYRIGVAASVIAYTHQQASVKNRVALMLMLMRIVERRSTMSVRAGADLLGVDYLSLRVSICRLRKNIDRHCAQLLKGRKLQLDEDHRLMRRRLADSFGKDLAATLNHYYKKAVFLATGILA